MPVHCKDRPKDPREQPRQLQGEELRRQRAQLHQQLDKVARHNRSLEQERSQQVADLVNDSAEFAHRMHRQEQDGSAIRGSLEDMKEAYVKQVGKEALAKVGIGPQAGRPAWLTGQPRR